MALFQTLEAISSNDTIFGSQSRIMGGKLSKNVSWSILYMQGKEELKRHPSQTCHGLLQISRRIIRTFR